MRVACASLHKSCRQFFTAEGNDLRACRLTSRTRHPISEHVYESSWIRYSRHGILERCNGKKADREKTFYRKIEVIIDIRSERSKILSCLMSCFFNLRILLSAFCIEYSIFILSIPLYFSIYFINISIRELIIIIIVFFLVLRLYRVW